MDAKVIWLFVFVVLYWTYCISMGIRGARSARTASDYFIAGRKIGLWVFVLAATATSFSGWTFMGHPGLIYTDGFQYAYASFYAITIPFTGVLFLKRQWMLGKRYGFVTPGEMLANYFKGDAIRMLTVLVALVFSIPYLGVQLQASGFLFHVLTDGLISVNVGMWLLSLVVLIYVATGGLRAVAYVDTVQCVLLAFGIAAIGVITLSFVGGWSALNEATATLAQFDQDKTPDGYSHYVAIPGVIQFVSDGTEAAGGAWTGIMVLTYMFALMGIQSAPAFSMWSYSNNNPKPFAPQQVWASSFGIGIILMLASAIQGVGAHFLGADLEFFKAHPEHVNPVLAAPMVSLRHPDWSDERVASVADKGIAAVREGRGTGQLVDMMDSAEGENNVVPRLMYTLSETAPWFVALLAICALAAMQSTGAAYMSTAGGMLTRDLLKRYLMPNASHAVQKFFGRLGVLLIVLGALVVATYSTDALVLLGGLAVAYGFQMYPALIAVCFWPWLTRAGVTVGLIAGLIAVTVTDSLGAQYMPWGRWPWTIHSAGWGIIFNLGLAVIVSALTQNRADYEHRMTYHNFLREHASLPASKRGLVPIAWIITLVWFFFGIGPGAVLGNTIFGAPSDPNTWVFGIPSIWAWQLLWWALGVFMMWFLAYRMEMSTVPSREVEALAEDIGDERLAAAARA